jgi:TIR domain
MTRQEQTSDLFVSYATEDLHRGVSDIFMALFEVGITSLWLDRLVIEPGESIPKRIDEGIRKTRYLLPIITETYFKKDWTRSELDAVRMLSKPAIPIWINVEAKAVQAFSPTLAAHKAIIYNSNPYEVAEHIGEILMKNKRTHFYKTRDMRKEATLFWQLAYIYILYVVQGQDPDNIDEFNELNQIAVNSPISVQEHVRQSINMSHQAMLDRAAAFRQHARTLGNEITDEDIAHIICGEIKRTKAWFPHEPREHQALRILGLDSFT